MFRKSLRYFLGLFLILSFHQSFASGTCPTTIPPCPGFTTYTQGGWGATPSGNNPGTYLQNNFANAFPNGLTIGCTFKVILTNATAVRNFLPQGTTARALTGSLTNPSKTIYSNVLAGQLVAAMLNVTFDRNNPSFGSSNTQLGQLVISSGIFQNWTVDQLIIEANKFIGGCPSSSAYTAADFNTALTNINQSYDNGVASGNFLLCPIEFTAAATPVKCFGGSTGSASISNILGGAGAPYTILWSTGSTRFSINNLSAGTYSFTITDAIGLTKTGFVTITQPSQLVANSTAGSIACYGGNTTVTVSANGGTPPYTGTGTFTVSAGSYSYTVTDANGCTATTSVTISQPSLLTANSSAGTILCNGGSTTVTVGANGGTTPYTGTGNFNNKTAGTYNYTVTDAKGCTASTSVTISQPSVLTANSSAGTILCNGGSTTVTVGANGGTTPYSGMGNFNNKTAGTYNYTVTDANGCTASTSVTITQPSVLTANSSAGTILCNGGSTTVTVGANGGTTPYTGTGNFTNKTAGTYNYTVTDANGCSASTSVTITEPALLTANSSAGTILCNGGSTTVTVGANGGTTPYSGTGNFNNKTAGTYNYTVTDANGCSASTSVTITEPTLLTANSSAGTILCNGGNTTVTVGANGGTTPYNGTGNFTNKTAGTYNYTVTDANGCTATTSVTISQPSVLTANSSAGTILCNGGSTTVTVGANGGTTPYTGTGNFTNKTAGTYNYIVTDANGCTAATSVTVAAAPSAITINGTKTDDNSCNGGSCSGTVSLNVNGGTAPYSYTWTNNASTGNSAIGFCTGTSTTVTVTDANGCLATQTYSFSCTPNPCVPCSGYVSYTQGGWGASPNGNNPGTILNNYFSTAFPNGLTIGCTNKLVFTTAAAVRAFLPSGTTARALNAGTLTNPTSATYSNVLAGQLVAAMLTAKIDASVNSFAPSNQQFQNLIINTGKFKNMTVAQVISAANQFIGGCTAFYTAADFNTVLTSINQSWDNGINCGVSNVLSCPINITKTSTNNPCYGNSKGSINLNVCGGCGTYSYSWSNGSTTKNLTNLTAGTYIVTITDNCGLTKKDTTIITQPSALSVVSNSTDDNSCNDGICSGTASVVVSGGTSPYSYNWNIGGTTSAVSGICFGNNPIVTISDANACTSTSSFVINCTPSAGACDPLTTFTQGGWGAAPNGNNPGTYLSSNFNSAFSKGLVIGFGTSIYTFTSNTAIQKVLPAGGTPAALTAPFITNPTTVNSVFAGQLIAATLNVGFDYYDPNFAAPSRNLGTMYCNFAPFLGMTVDQVILEANQAIGGKPTFHSIPDLTMALDFINRNYDNGIDDNGDLICNDPNASRSIAPQNSSPVNSINTKTNTTGFNLFPNPTNNNEVVLQFTASETGTSIVNIYSLTGQLLLNQNVSVSKGNNSISLNLNSINQNNSMVIVQLINNGQTFQSNLAITR